MRNTELHGCHLHARKTHAERNGMMGAQTLDISVHPARQRMDDVFVEKRDGRVVTFDAINIMDAVTSAFGDLGRSVGPEEESLIRDLAHGVEGEIRRRSGGTARVEDIRHLVESALVERHLGEVARAYAQCRLDRDAERGRACDITAAVGRLVNHDESLVRENANKDSNVYATQRDLLAGAVSKASAFSMLPDAVANAHLKGDIHFHDADYSPFTAMTNCSLPDFGDMLAHGFALGNATMDSPKSIGTAATQITQIIKDIAGAQYGGQTVNRADEMLEPYARRDYEKHLAMARAMIPDSTPVDVVRTMVQAMKSQEPGALHIEDRAPLEPDTSFSEDAPEIERLREVYAKIMTRKAIYDAMQTMEYQINSNRVSNGQTPFVTVGFGLGTSWFAREIQRAILLNRIRGLGRDRHTAIFPKLVFAVKRGVNAAEGDPNHDLKRLALECSTKRMYPDVVFYENIVAITGSFKAPMGCRSFLQGWVDPRTGKNVEDGRMNLGVVTVNVPRIALESHGDQARFRRLFEERMRVAHQALAFRIARCKQATPVNAPTLFRHGAFGRLGAHDDVDRLFRNGRATVSLGYIGLYETTAVFYGKDWMRDHGWDEEGKRFALSLVRRMNELCRQWSLAEGYHYSVYSTPAESLTDRFNRLDRERFGTVAGVTDHDFYTNSFHYPVWLQPTPMEKLDYEKDFPYLASGGFINYCEFPCLQTNPRALEAVWDYAHSIGIGYLGTNTPIDHCFECGFQGDFMPTEEGFQCPECGNHDPDRCNVTKRTCGYLGNPVQRPMVHGRHEEIAHRVKHMAGQTGYVRTSDGCEHEWFEDTL